MLINENHERWLEKIIIDEVEVEHEKQLYIEQFDEIDLQQIYHELVVLMLDDEQVEDVLLLDEQVEVENELVLELMQHEIEHIIDEVEVVDIIVLLTVVDENDTNE